MLGNVTLGQFFPGDSIIHKLDPRIKLILVIIYICTVFAAKSFASYAVVFAFLLFVIFASGIDIRIILKSIKPVMFVVAFTALANLFWTSGERLLFSFWIINIYLEGVIFALLMVLRLICLIAGTFVLLTYTTSPVALTDAIERLLSPLQKIGVPTHEFAMMMTIALRFIPTLIEETEKIINAQKARGADFETGSLIKRTRALVPILIPLFVSAFRRADELACAMECRLYHGGEGRTRMKVLHVCASDILFLLASVAILALVLLLNFIL